MAISQNLDTTDDVVAYEADNTLRELVGPDTPLAEIFTPRLIQECQKKIDSARDAFFDIAGYDLARLEAFVKVQMALPEATDAWFEEVASLAGNIKGHAELFNFGLVASITHHIVSICEPGTHASPVRLRLIADLVTMLRIAIRQKISDERGALGRELGASLRRY